MNADEALYEFQMKLKEAEKALDDAIRIAANEFGRDTSMRPVMDALDEVRNTGIYYLRSDVEEIRSDISSYYFEQDGFLAY